MSWLECFERESGIKNAIILHGNILDIVLNPEKNKYENVIDTVIDILRKKGYEQIVKWDRIEGLDTRIIETSFIESVQQDDELNGNTTTMAYELDDDDMQGFNTNQGSQLKEIDEFFPFVLKGIREGHKKVAYIIDYSDYIFGNANALSEKEREWLSILAKGLQESNNYNMLSERFDEISSLIILVTQKLAYIPPAFYLNNPMVSDISIPIPSRSERNLFVRSNYACLNLDKDLKISGTYNDFIDALEGETLKDIAQMMCLSKQMSRKGILISFDKLLNLYKYGEKSSPWEELSKDKLKTIEERLGERVKGQGEAIEKVKDVIIRAYTGFSGLQHSTKQRKPKGTLFFVGPTGVGKTELAKALAEFLFGDENACIRFDMSEFNHEHSDQRLVGAPPGYVGYEEGGQLTNIIKERPFSVILFDEIEKAHGKILDKFLQILEDGRLTDGKGETVSFSEAVIIFTSNIGAAEISMKQADKENQNRSTHKEFVDKVKDHFIHTLKRPELLNRIGDNNIVPFNFICDQEVYTKIVRIKFAGIEHFVKERYKAEVMFENEQQAFTAIAQKAGYQNGGRGALNALEETVVNPLATFIFDNYERIGVGRKIVITQDRPHRAAFDFELR